MSGEQEEEGQAKRLNMEKRILEKLDQLIGVAKKAEVNDKEIFKKALDDLVNVNSLFTIAVFVGLSVASRNQYSLENRRECDAGPEVAKRLVVFEVISFACFLLSSLIAKSLKIKVGKLSCGSYYTVTAVATLSVIVFIGVLIYLPSMLFTIFYIMFRIPNQGSSNDKGSQSLVKEFQV
ncbi:hypothetical protein NC653_033812 [Populus alba x Populus x berolinensis]|uniref:Uncharacterized protein n=2 Tax=Populus TaxID=3689 RepID=A0A4U5Q0G1_POPAL|nr:hypothetical protein NC653_033812 [Populus alba x Populus x berolinensis]TKS02067.1 hypothetical protein D5086_0000166600 [Populus alba]